MSKIYRIFVVILQNYRIIEYPESEGSHKGHRAQLLDDSMIL